MNAIQKIPNNTNLLLRLGILDEMFNAEECFFVEVVDLQDAKNVWNYYLKRQADSSSFIGGDVFISCQCIAIFSTNLRCWKPYDKGNAYYNKLPSNTEILI